MADRKTPSESSPPLTSQLTLPPSKHNLHRREHQVLSWQVSSLIGRPASCCSAPSEPRGATNPSLVHDSKQDCTLPSPEMVFFFPFCFGVSSQLSCISVTSFFFLQLLVKTNGWRVGRTAAASYDEDVSPKFNLSINVEKVADPRDFECACLWQTSHCWATVFFFLPHQDRLQASRRSVLNGEKIQPRKKWRKKFLVDVRGQRS